MKEQRCGGGRVVFFLPLLLPCHLLFNVTPTSQNTFSLSSSLCYWCLPDKNELAHHKYACITD